MTKKIRIENADNSTYKVRIYQEWLVNGQWVRSAEGIQPRSSLLAFPAELSEQYIHSTQRLVVEESNE